MFSWDAVEDFLRQRNVTLLSAGLDEVPRAYKDIDAVTAAQSDMVEPLAQFEPRLVWLDPNAFKQVEHAALRVARDGVDSEVGQQMGVTSSYSSVLLKCRTWARAGKSGTVA